MVSQILQNLHVLLDSPAQVLCSNALPFSNIRKLEKPKLNNLLAAVKPLNPAPINIISKIIF
jgi:hypothetical protein